MINYLLILKCLCDFSQANLEYYKKYIHKSYHLLSWDELDVNILNIKIKIKIHKNLEVEFDFSVHCYGLTFYNVVNILTKI